MIRRLVTSVLGGIVCLLSVCPAGAQTSPLPVINEFMAANHASVPDPQGQYDDWIELYNPADQAYVGTVAPVVFSVPRGFYDKAITVALTCATPGAQIWYTLDTTIPHVQSPRGRWLGIVYDALIREERPWIVPAESEAAASIDKTRGSIRPMVKK